MLNFPFFKSNKTNFQQKSFPLERFYLDDLDFQSLGNSKSSSYKNNVIVNRCVNLISQSASHVPFTLFHDNVNLKKHPVLNLLNKPNPFQAGAEFFEHLIANKLLFGNGYVAGVSGHDNKFQEIYVLHPEKVSIKTKSGIPISYKYSSENQNIEYPVDKITGKSKILHIKNYNPSNHFQGMSAIESAGQAIKMHNKAADWNNSLLTNGARPSGALIVKNNNGFLSDEQFDRLKEQLQEKYSGSNNSGRPLLLEGGIEWQEMSISPKDMDFVASKNAAAREIALSLGVPPQLLGIAGDNTYSNMQEARLALWEETIIPLLDNLTDSLSSWLSLNFNESLTVKFDCDAISALSEKRENLWAKINNADFMTLNEKRAIVGLPPIAAGDKISL